MNKLVASVVLVSLISLAGMKCFGDNESELGYLGVMTRSVDPALASQLGLAEGMGLVIIDTVDESPADAVLAAHDVILKLNDQKIVNQEQFSALVRMENPGTEISLAIIRGGKALTKEISLGEQDEAGCCPGGMKCMSGMPPRFMPFMGKMHHGRPNMPFPGMPPHGGGFPPNMGMPPQGQPGMQVFGMGGMEDDGMGEIIEGVLDEIFEEAMEEIEEQSEKWPDSISKDERNEIMESIEEALGESMEDVLEDMEEDMDDDDMDDIDGECGDIPCHARFFKSINMTKAASMVDEDTAFELQVDDQAKHLVIRGEDNKTVFDGNIGTDEEWEKIPKEYRDKVRELCEMVGE